MKPALLLAASGAVLALAGCQSPPRAGQPFSAAAVTAATPDRVSRFGCSDGQSLSASFYEERNEAVIARGGGFSVTLPARPATSGVWYADDAYELRGQLPEVTFGRVGEDAVVCRVVG